MRQALRVVGDVLAAIGLVLLVPLVVIVIGTPIALLVRLLLELLS